MMDRRDEFMDSGIINCDDLNKARHVIIGLNYDITSSGLKGADKGPSAVVKALREQIEPYNPLLGCAPCEGTEIAYHSLGDLNNLTPEAMVCTVAIVCEKFFRDGKELTILGGEHSVTIPALRAYARVYNPELVTILHIDAHLDLRNTDEFRAKPYGGYAHCCVMRRAYEYGFQQFLQVGARSFSKEEWEFARANMFTVFRAANHMPEPATVVGLIRTERIWVSLDVDGICPGDMPATGTPVGGGPSLDYVRELLACVGRERFIVGADVVEVAPDLGLTDVTAYNAAQLAYDLIGYRVIKK